MKVGVPKETAEYEARVALAPDGVKKLVAAGAEVLVQRGAGAGSHMTDAAYETAGATLIDDAPSVYQSSDIILKVQPPTTDDVQHLREGVVVISLLQAVGNREVIDAMTSRKVTGLSMNRVPRITRAQAMDVLSSQSNLAGYKAVVMGAAALGKILPMMMTAAGTVPPAKVFILGAGVAGLQAIATAKRLGAVVTAFDVRPAVKEQVESLGGRFLEIDLGGSDTEDAGGYAKELSEEAHKKEQELVHGAVKDADIVITTALIPDKPAPTLITAEMVQDMRAGAVIVDLAGEAGGNCELTEYPGEVVQHGVTIIAPPNLPASVSVNASQLYSRNVSALLLDLMKDGELKLDFEDEIVAGSCVTHAGEVKIAP